jgi:hypothetical protein
LSFWDRLGTLAKDTTGALTASPKFLWDVATAPWNDNEEFNGFANTFKTAGTKLGQSLIKPISDIAETPGIKQTLQGIDTFNREYIREPLTTGLLAATETGGDFGKAKELAQNTSFGQALVGGIGAVLPGQQAVDKINYEDTAAVDKFFSTGAPRFWSGVGDVSIQVFGDVTIAGGKAAKIARESSLVTNKINNAQKAAKAINDFSDAGNGVVNRMSKPLEDFVANGAEYAYNHPMIRKSPMRDTLAYGLGQANNTYDASLIMRAALADPRALEELQIVRASIGNPMARQQGILDPYQEFLLKKADDPTGIASLPHTDQVVVQDAIKELEDLRNTDSMFAAWEQMAKTPGGVIDRTVGARPMQAIDDFLAKGRSAKFVAGGTRAEAWQPTPFHRMYQVVSWLGNERPAGIVNLNEAESSAEVMAFVNRAHSIAGDDMYTFLPSNSDVLKQFKGVNDERAAGMMAGYYRATTPEERATSLSIIENAGFSAICGKYGIDRATANEIYQNHWRSRMGAQESLRKNGFMIDEDGGLISAPVFESQTANYLPMMDLDILNSVLKQHKLATKSKSLATIYGLGNEVTGAMDILQTIFKAGVLMRLGYTIRNGTEAQLRIAASVGSMASMRHLGPGIKNLALNTNDTLFARTVDRLSISGGPATYQSTKRSLDKVDSELGDLQAKYQSIADEYNKQLDNSAPKFKPEETVLGSPSWSGGPKLFHGTPDPIENDSLRKIELNGEEYKLLYGPGFYSTEDASIAKSYTKKGAGKFKYSPGDLPYDLDPATKKAMLQETVGNNPTVYSVKWTGESNPVLLNGDKAIPQDFAEYLKDYFAGTSGNTLELLNNPNTNYGQIVSSIKKDIVKEFSGDLPDSEITSIISETLYELNNTLSTRFGYDGIEHIGGLATNQKTLHGVKIFFNTDKLKLVKAERKDPNKFTSAKFTDEEVNQLDQGILPNRFGRNSGEYEKARKTENKRLAAEHRSLVNNEDMQAKIDEATSAFNLTKKDINLLENKGLIPLNKVLEAYRYSKLQSDELSAIISTGKIESVNLDGPLYQDYVYYPEGDLKYYATQNGKSRQKYIEVPWHMGRVEDYIKGNIESFNSYWEELTINRLLTEYTDEANAWYGQNATQTYSPTTPNVQLESDMRLIEKAIADKKSVREDYAKQLTELEKSAKRGEKRKIGQGKWKVKSAFGDNYDNFSDALGGQFADIHRTNASAENSMNTLVDDNAGLFSRSLTKTGYGEVKPDAPNYYQAWSDALNYQFRNSAVAMKLMEDGADPADVAKWLRIDPEGRITAKRLSLDSWEIDSHVAAVKGFVDSYIPSRDLRQLLIKSEDSAPISPDMLRGTFTGTDGLPTIHGHILEENLNLVSRKHAKEIVNGVFRLIGSMPEDLLARHPLYISLYRTELERRVKMFEGMNERRLTTQEQADLMSVTHKVALRQLKNTLFTIDRKTNLAYYMRFISPFFSAFENTAKTWAKIAYEKPETINRANLIFTSPNRAGIATDENGNPVPPDQASVNDYIWLEVPEVLKKAPFIGSGLTSLTQMGIQKRSLDVVFQGDIAQIPVGPYVAIPISEMVKRKPELEDSLKWAIPFGPERNAVRAFLPAWVKRQLTKADGQSNQQYANTYALIWTTEQHKRRESGQPAATASEVQKMTDAYYNMRTVANLILPFAPTFQTPYKFYVDQWRQYQEKFGMDAQTKYWQDYGDDFFEFTQSLSKNTTGSFASVGSVTNAKAYAGLISDLSLIDPKLIGIVTNAGQAYDFSQAAYMWQQSNTISPSSSEYYRTRKDPAEAALDNERSLGWIKYRNVMAGIDSEMQRRGLTNLQSKAGADLASLKKQTVAQLGASNTAWYDDYLDTDGSKTNKVIRGLEAIVNNKKFMSQYGDNPTFKSIAVYLNVRQQIEKELASRPSKSIDAKTNADIKFVFDSVANQLKQQDIGFGDLYDRWLSYDSVYDAVHSQGVAQ